MGGKPLNSQGPSPRRAPGLHSALPEDHSCFFQISRAHLHLHPSPEGHHRELAIVVRAEGAGLGWGGHWTKTLLSPSLKDKVT